jgi:hypothetical protein
MIARTAFNSQLADQECGCAGQIGMQTEIKRSGKKCRRRHCGKREPVDMTSPTDNPKSRQ